MSTIDLGDRLRRIRLRNDSEEEPADSKLVGDRCHCGRAMIVEMMRRAEANGRDFMSDVFQLISLRMIDGPNIGRMLAQWTCSQRTKEELITMARIYGISSTAEPYSSLTPTLAKIDACLPHVALVIAGQIQADPHLRLRHWVSDAELGAEISHHFKLCYYPSLVNVAKCGPKGLAGFVLYNLCNAKAILNSSPKNGGSVAAKITTASAFAASCRFSLRMMDADLAPPTSKDRFTEYVKSLPITPQLLDRVWSTVVGNTIIFATETTLVTPFHRAVFAEQPLNLRKWMALMNNDDEKFAVL